MVKQHDYNNNVIYFENNIEYHYNTDADDDKVFDLIPDIFDMYFRGYIPPSWLYIKKMKKIPKRLYIACDDSSSEVICEQGGILIHPPYDSENEEYGCCCGWSDSEDDDDDDESEKMSEKEKKRNVFVVF